MGDEMRVLLLLLLACIGAATTHTFDTDYIPGQHSVILVWTCDDKADSQYVNIATEYGFSMTFAPYANTVTDINGDFDGDPYYDEWLIGWAKNQGMDFAVHAQPNAVSALAAGGRDSVETIWDEQAAFISRWSGTQVANTGFVWVGYANSPELRAMAKSYGFKWTRGGTGGAYAPDLYLNGGGWGNPTGVTGYRPPIMYHKALVPQVNNWRFNTSQSSYTVNSTKADSTGWWVGTHQALDSLHRKCGMAIMNPHPGWTGQYRETLSRDSSFARDVELPNGNKVIFSGRQGQAGRNDISAYQMSIIMEAVADWDSLKLATDGVRRVCILNMAQLMSDPDIPFRTDNTADPDTALAHDFGSADSTDTYGVYEGDVALTPKADFTVYVDGTGDVVAGNGTLAYPLPWSAINDLFNCTVEVVGHAVGDTLTLPTGIDMRCGNVTFNLNGLVLTPTGSGVWIKYSDSASNIHYLRDIEWKNGTFDGKGGSANSISVGDVTSYTTQILRPARVTFKGMTFRNGNAMLWPQQVQALVVDSCFFVPTITGNNTSCIDGGYGLYRPIIRNSYFDMTGGGTGSVALDFGSSATLTWEDSLAIVNNVFKTGTSSHYILSIRAQADLDSTTIGRQIRFGGNYIVSNKASTPTTVITGPGLTTIASLEAQIANNEPTFVDKRNYYRGAGSTFNAMTHSSDTLRFGGSTCWAANMDNGNAWIGPSKYGYLPLMWTSGAVQGRPSTATLAGPWEVLKLVNAGVLATSNITSPSTWFEIPRIYDESSLAVARSFLDAWEKWPAAAQAKVRFKVSGEPVTTITAADGSVYQTLGALDAAITAASESASDSLTASTWFTLPRPYNLNAAFQIEILRAWHRTLAVANRQKIHLRVSGTDFSLAQPDTTYSNGLWAGLKAITTGAETASDSLNADTWFIASRVYDMAQAQQFGIYRDAWVGWNDATRKKIRMKTK